MKRFVVLMLMMVGQRAWGAPAGLAGNWATGDGSVVRVAECGAEICLTVVKVTAAATETRDRMNPDAALRTRALCGLRIGSGFRKDGAEGASGGRLYDPKSGKTYSGKMELKGDSLRLRGYVGVALFGRTEVWKRVGDVVGCG